MDLPTHAPESVNQSLACGSAVLSLRPTFRNSPALRSFCARPRCPHSLHRSPTLLAHHPLYHAPPPSSQVFAALSAAASASAAAPRAVLFVKHVSGASDRLFAELKQRSDPKSDLYLDWLSQDQVGGILLPHPDHLATVLTIAAEFGAHAANGGVDVIGTGDKVVVTFPGVAAVPAAFLAKAAASGALDVAPSTNTNADASFHTSFDISMPPRHKAKPRQQAETSKGLRRADGAQASTADPQACLANIMGVDGACVRAAYGLTGTAAGKLAAGQAFVVNQPFSQRCVWLRCVVWCCLVLLLLLLLLVLILRVHMQLLVLILLVHMQLLRW